MWTLDHKLWVVPLNFLFSTYTRFRSANGLFLIFLIIGTSWALELWVNAILKAHTLMISRIIHYEGEPLYWLCSNVGWLRYDLTRACILVISSKSRAEETGMGSQVILPSYRLCFHSPYVAISSEYRVWCIGSAFSLIGMPFTALISRYDLDSVRSHLYSIVLDNYL